MYVYRTKRSRLNFGVTRSGVSWARGLSVTSSMTLYVSVFSEEKARTIILHAFECSSTARQHWLSFKIFFLEIMIKLH